ncbi:MAG TPA: UDP-N-acetylmuramate:L-alanyl-gamma-D-glutamyl-meso-diaminopimelate ligase [Vicinamibacterales bacterium]|nr:UDP-N-acetylmuramate:L-alanyl-gamma-D-glutamyl-meso-diaminopimelate ligase [Vicinamibacterales bacterium]
MARIHLIGVCGTAMATLAAMLKHRGHEVSGSDEHVYPPMSDFLAAEQITVLEGYRPEHVSGVIDLVVVGNAISRGNPELESVLDRGLRYASLPETIRDQWLWDADAIVIAGTHGKTTTTAITGWLLTAAGADPTVLVGGIARNLGAGGASYRMGKGRAFVIEGDEYDSAYFDKTAKFLKYLPDIAVVNNLEFDHADIYKDLDEVRLAFRRLVNLVPAKGLILLGADSPDAAALAPSARSRVQTFGLADGADWRATDVEIGATTSFRVRHGGEDLGVFTMSLAGEHNVRNALAALAIGVDRGLDIDALRTALASFAGVKRRLEVVGEANGVTIYDDFAHHPTAVDETLRAVRRAQPGRRIWAIFEPRSASSCRRVFQDDFAHAFAGADEVVLASVFRSTLPPEERLSESQLVADLTARNVRARHLPTVDAIVDLVARDAQGGDLVVVMSNGGFGGIHGKLLEALAGATRR